MKQRIISILNTHLLCFSLILFAGNVFAFDENLDLEDDVRLALAAREDTAYLQTGKNELQLIEVDGNQVIFQKISNDLEILGNKVIVYVDDNDEIVRIEDDSTANLVIGPRRTRITADAAMDTVLAGLDTLKSDHCDARLVWFRNGNAASLAWQVEVQLLPGDAPVSPTDLHTVVDAMTGDILSQSQHDINVYKEDPKTGTGIFPRRPIVINNAIGAAGARAYALDFPEVCAISGCTATLIAPNRLIAARHCGAGPGDVVRFGPNRNNPVFSTTVQSVVLPDGGGTLLDGGDVAIIRLNSSVPSGVANPMRFVDETSALLGMTCSMIGYGYNGLGSSGHGFTSDGFRWGGENIIDRYGVPAGAGGSNIFSTDFDNGTGAANTISGSSPTPVTYEATTAPGDSGGPIIVKINGENLIAGVLSGGTTSTSVYGDISWWTGTADFRSQIEANGGEFYEEVPPANDAWMDAINIADLDFNETGTNVNATIQPNETQLANTGSTVWWRVEADVDGDLTIDTFGSNFDTQLHVYENAATLSTVTLVANNNNTGGSQSQVTFHATAGKVYDIRVGGFAASGGGAPAEGDIVLNGTFVPGCQFEKGDINEDGMVTNADIAPFVALLLGGGYLCQADINEDGLFTNADIAPFVALLLGGG